MLLARKSSKGDRKGCTQRIGNKTINTYATFIQLIKKYFITTFPSQEHMCNTKSSLLKKSRLTMRFLLQQSSFNSKIRSNVTLPMADLTLTMDT